MSRLWKLRTVQRVSSCVLAGHYYDLLRPPDNNINWVQHGIAASQATARDKEARENILKITPALFMFMLKPKTLYKNSNDKSQ